MDTFSRIFEWLSDHEAGISAVAAILAIAVIVFTGLRLLLRRRSQPANEDKSEEDPLLALPTGPVIAVLPFENLSGDPEQEYFSDGLTEDLTNELARPRRGWRVSESGADPTIPPPPTREERRS